MISGLLIVGALAALSALVMVQYDFYYKFFSALSVFYLWLYFIVKGLA